MIFGYLGRIVCFSIVVNLIFGLLLLQPLAFGYSCDFALKFVFFVLNMVVISISLRSLLIIVFLYQPSRQVFEDRQRLCRMYLAEWVPLLHQKLRNLDLLLAEAFDIFWHYGPLINRLLLQG